MKQVKICEECGYAFIPELSDKDVEMLFSSRMEFYNPNDSLYERYEKHHLAEYRDDKTRYSSRPIPFQDRCPNCRNLPVDKDGDFWHKWTSAMGNNDSSRPRRRIKRLMPPDENN